MGGGGWEIGTEMQGGVVGGVYVGSLERGAFWIHGVLMRVNGKATVFTKRADVSSVYVRT